MSILPGHGLFLVTAGTARLEDSYHVAIVLIAGISLITRLSLTQCFV